jgi:hypothetical protein
MKKLLIICLALIVFLTSCDLSYFKDWGKTPDTEVGGEQSNEEEKKLPQSEASTLSELINVEDVAYVEYSVTYQLDCSIPRPYCTDNVDSFFDILSDGSADMKFVTDIEGVHDLFDENFKNSWDVLATGEYYVIYYLLDNNNKAIASGTIYPDKQIGVTVHQTKVFYFSASPSNVNLDLFIESINEKSI